MKVLLYFEWEKVIQTSGIGRALKHQQEALNRVGIDWTTDPLDEFDLLHINTYGPNSSAMIGRARKEGKPVVYHAHSTEEDFRNSFVLSNRIAPSFKKMLINLYSQADQIITPTPYSKKLLEGYGITVPITAISNGIDCDRFAYDEQKVQAFRKYFSLNPQDKVVISVGLFFERKGLADFVEVAKRLPQYKFIWFGNTPLVSIPKAMRDLVKDPPRNVYFPGYVKGGILEGAYQGADCFFFPTHEETEGIVVLEALASRQQCVLRDIGAFSPWLLNGVNCYMGSNNDDFTRLVRDVVEKRLPDLSAAGALVAQQRDLTRIGEQLKEVYQNVQSSHLS